MLTASKPAAPGFSGSAEGVLAQEGLRTLVLDVLNNSLLVLFSTSLSSRQPCAKLNWKFIPKNGRFSKSNNHLLQISLELSCFRLDFVNLAMTQPPSSGALLHGDCATSGDFLTLNSPSGYEPPITCGTLTGQHSEYQKGLWAIVCCPSLPSLWVPCCPLHRYTAIEVWHCCGFYWSKSVDKLTRCMNLEKGKSRRNWSKCVKFLTECLIWCRKIIITLLQLDNAKLFAQSLELSSHESLAVKTQVVRTGQKSIGAWRKDDWAWLCTGWWWRTTPWVVGIPPG